MLRRVWLGFGALLILLAAAGVGSYWLQSVAPEVPAPDAVTADIVPTGFTALNPPLQMGDLAFQDADGKTVRISDFHGRPVVLNIWAKWCAPCVVELPTLDKLQRSAAPGTLAVVAVAVDEQDPQKVRNFLTNRNLNALHPYLDPKNVFAKALAIHSIPVSVLIDKNGYGLVRADAPADWFSDQAIQLLKQTIL
ncbi:MAG TPA: TlpA disulfide reductase family protein [Candidatus Binatia bacterium]|nr:TlpA disulfide reductase family protein [Candidatus Binatia bacterium]